MAWLFLLFWPVFALNIGLMQGPLMPAIRRTSAGPEAAAQSRALHLFGALVYFLPVALSPAGVPFWLWAATAVVARVVLFDVGLNLSDGNSDTGPFHVGQTATYDKWLRKLSPGSPDKLNALLKLASLGAYAAAVAGLLAWL